MGGQLLLLLTLVLIYAIALSFVALGGMFSERSGVINIGLEGIMVVGGFCGIVTLNALMKANVNPFFCVLLTILVSIIAGMAYSLLLAVVTINCKADQTLAGTALNLASTALALILTKKINNGISTSLQFDNTYFVIKMGDFSTNVFFFIGVAAIIISYFVLYKTRFGLRLRSCGENPSASDSVGINVNKYRYAGVLISGALGGIGGIAYVIPTQSFWNSSSGVSGFGFLALAIMIFGQWKPIRISIISIIFSLFFSFSFVYSGIIEAATGITLTYANGVTSELFKMIPFIASLILLAFTSKKSRAPKAEGIPYDKTKR